MSSLASKALVGQKATIYNLVCDDITSEKITTNFMDLNDTLNANNISSNNAEVVLNSKVYDEDTFVYDGNPATVYIIGNTVDVRKGIITLTDTPFNIPSEDNIVVQIQWPNLNVPVGISLLLWLQLTAGTDTEFLRLRVDSYLPNNTVAIDITNIGTDAFNQGTIEFQYQWT